MAIDTHVYKVCLKLDIIDGPNNKLWERYNKPILERCRKLNISPVQFTKGVWWVGYKDILHKVLIDFIENCMKLTYYI